MTNDATSPVISNSAVEDLFLQGVALHSSGNTAAAAEIYARVLELNPDHAGSNCNLGSLLRNIGNLAEAIPLLRKAAALEPANADVWYNLGNALRDAGQQDAAVVYQKALTLRPEFALAWYNLGLCMQDGNQLNEARQAYRRSAELSPHDHKPWVNMGSMLESVGQVSEAIACYQKALAASPSAEDSWKVWNNIGTALQSICALDDALEAYQKAITLAPDISQPKSNRLMCLQYHPGMDDAALLAAALSWGNEITKESPAACELSIVNTQDRPLRVGYVSADFSNHPVGLFVAPVIAAHDKAQIIPYCYSNGGRVDYITQQLQACSQWRSIENLDDKTVCRMIVDDEIDILVDLAGHTAKTRLPLFARRPAQVQVSWLGYFATTGLSTIDYVIMDRWHVPVENEGQFCETVIRMPYNRFCYQPPVFAGDVAPPPSYSKGFVTFGSFNNTTKLNGVVIALWAQILREVPASRLVLKWKTFADPQVCERLGNAFIHHGIHPERLEFRTQSVHKELLEQYADIDIALDPFPFCGGHTSCEALWMGVPVITMPGERTVSRQTLSFLACIGLTEGLVADSPQQYLKYAVELACDKEKLLLLRRHIREAMASSPLCQVEPFTRSLELLYKQMTVQKKNVQLKAPPPDEIQTVVALFKDSRFSEIEPIVRQMIERFPMHGFGWKALGSVLKLLGRVKESLRPLQQAIELSPEDAEAYCNLGTALTELGRLQDAGYCYRQALLIRPDYAEANYNLGNILHDLGAFEEAEYFLRRVLTIQPDHAEAYNNLGNVLNDGGNLTGAAASWRQAIQIKPDYAEAYSNLGVALKDLGCLPEAEAALRKALEIKPDYTTAYSNLLFILNYSANNQADHYLEDAKKFGAIAASKAKTVFTSWKCPVNPEKLRVGLVSGDFRNHPVGYFLENILAHINPSRLELIAYTTNNKTDELTTRIKPHFSAWNTLSDKGDEVAADRIHSDSVHILLDLSGHSAKNRLPLFAWKPAPVQATWLGYFATTGVAEMDYIIGDPYNTPAEEESHFTEKIWRLPETSLCFTPPDLNIDVGALPAVASGHVTFGCFNNLTKLNDAVLELWARVLQAVPDSRLFIKAKQLGDAAIVETLRNRFDRLAIPADRLILEKGSPRPEYLSSYNRIDIALDPFPFPGGTTSAECLWMGVPVLTKRGDCFLSHQGETILTNAGLPKWIADNDDDYVAKAVQYASDLDSLTSLRAGLRQQVLTSPLFDAERFARNLEDALWGMWRDKHDSGRAV